MIKVENQKIELSIFKNGKEIKKYDFKNTLTDAFLDLIVLRQLPDEIAEPIFDDVYTVSNYKNVINCFRYATFIFNNTKPLITVENSSLGGITDNNVAYITFKLSDISYTDNGIIVKSLYDARIKNYNFVTTGWHPAKGKKLQYICFSNSAPPQFGAATHTEILTSFVDVSDLDIYESDSLAFSTSRYDYIESNEIQITANDLKPHLPRVDNMLLTWKLDTITTCYSANGVGDMKSYSVADLTFTRLSAGVVEVSGFDNYKIESNVLLCSEDTICGEDTIITQPAEKIMSVKFKYTDGTSFVETYVNIEDLDVSYSDTEFKIKMKCERGAY